MHLYELQGMGNGKRVAVALAMLLIAYFVFGGGGGGTFVSTWRGDGPQPAAAAGLVGQAAQVGQGDTLVAPPEIPADQPWGNPVQAARVVMTQGYGVGSHAPAEVWGGIDLAVDGNGDGQADPDGSWGAPIRATMSGIVKLSPNSWPAGNHIWVIGDQYKTGYAHLQSFEVEDGQFVERGTIIGRMGSTGQANGPHLHYDVWLNEANHNPLDFHPLP